MKSWMKTHAKEDRSDIDLPFHMGGKEKRVMAITAIGYDSSLAYKLYGNSQGINNEENSFLFSFMNSMKQITNQETTVNAKNATEEGVMTDSENVAEEGLTADTENTTRGNELADRLSAKKIAPYSHLAKDGMIEYNGVTFMCDDEKQRITLGDVSNPKNCLTIPLSEGGCLVVNRDNLGDLSDAIGMFSPEDVTRILNAIAADNKAQEMQKQIEDDENSIGEAEDTIGGQIDVEEMKDESKDLFAETFSNMVNEEMLNKLCNDPGKSSLIYKEEK